MIQGFKDFVMRGNIVDLAVAVVIGTAFAAVVNVVVTSLINPVLARVGGASVGEGLGIQLGQAGNTATFIDIGAIINAVVVFLMTAAVVYFVIVVPMNRLAERRARGQEPGPDVVAEGVALLREIRDLLSQHGGRP
jgi:large conductance mechanosensitive channel